METNLIVLGGVFILTFFGVGEGIYKILGLKKGLVLSFIALMIFGLFLPDISIWGVNFSFSGFFILFFLSVILSFKTKSFSKFIVCSLISMLGLIVYKSFYIESFSNGFWQAYMPLCLILGGFLSLISSSAPSAISSMFLGFNLGEIIFSLNRFESLPSVFVGQDLLSCMLFVILSIFVTRFLVLKLKQLREPKTNSQNTIIS